MVNIEPIIYRNVFTIKNDRTVLYVQLQKALYRCLRSAILFYEKLVANLKSNGFIINPYEPCVSNMTVNGKQMTIIWHVDALKISHFDADEVTKVIDWMEGIYLSHTKDYRGKKHDYLGMELDF